MLRSVRALVVDDDGPSARLQSLLLRQAGAQVAVAHSVSEAKKSLELHRPQLVVFDLELPDATGLELARLIKAQPAHADAVLVVVSISGAEQNVRDALSAGCAGYLRKPISVETFTEQVSGFFTSSR